MKIFVMLFLMNLGSAFASANTYDLQLDLSINGKNKFSPKLIAEEGKLVTITHKNNNEDVIFVDVITTNKELKNTKEGVEMKFTAGTIDKNGERHNLFKTRVIAIENQLAKINQGSELGHDELSLSVIAKKQIQ